MAILPDRTELTTPADGDLYVTTDVSDTTDAATGTDKKITWANIKAALATVFAPALGADDNYVTDAEKAALHAAVTVTDSTEIDFTLTGQDITASLKSGSIDETKLDTSVNASLDLADSAVQPAGLSGYFQTANIDDTPVNGETAAPISSNWAYDHENSTTAHGATGAVVGTTNTQTLTNKTLTDAKIPTTENAQTGTTYTLVLTDASKYVSMSNASANTLTVPLNSSVAFPVGTKIMVQQRGAGSTTIAATGGVTINVPTSAPLAIAEQYGSRGLYKTATDTWQLI